MKDDIPAINPYFVPRLGLPKTALQIGTPKITVLIHVKDSHNTATSPRPLIGLFAFQFKHRAVQNAMIRAIARSIRTVQSNRKFQDEYTCTSQKDIQQVFFSFCL